MPLPNGTPAVYLLVIMQLSYDCVVSKMTTMAVASIASFTTNTAVRLKPFRVWPSGARGIVQALGGFQ